jgi:hypothetical protein
MSEQPNTPQQLTPSDSAEPDFAQMERGVDAMLEANQQTDALVETMIHLLAQT